MKFKDPNSEFNKFYQNIFLIFVFIVSKIKLFTKYFISLGFSFNLITISSRHNKDRNYPPAKFTGLRREKMWEHLIKDIDSFDNNINHILEFGVAWGYSTNFFLSKIKKEVSWFGFDSFLGLPSNWEEYKKGHFSNEGVPPEIKDQRINWITGLVEDSLPNFLSKHKKIISDNNLLILLDLDLFLPTYKVLNNLKPFLKKGDLIYFDEPNMNDEFCIFYSFLKMNEKAVKIKYYSPCNILLEILDNKII